MTVVNCAYILRKAFSSDIMLEKIEALCQILEVMPIEKRQLQEAIRLKVDDYEDAVQYFSALPYHPDVILTRDKRGFQNFGILVMTPKEFIKRVKE